MLEIMESKGNKSLRIIHNIHIILNISSTRSNSTHAFVLRNWIYHQDETDTTVFSLGYKKTIH